MSLPPYEDPAALWQLAQADATDLVFTVDRDLRLRYVNDAVCRIAGKSREELIGGTLGDAGGAERAAQAEAALREVLESGEPETMEHAFHYDSGARWMRRRLTPIRDEAGSVVGVLSVARDGTALRDAQGSAARRGSRLLALLDASGDCVYELDGELRVSTVNRGSEWFLGVPPQQAVGHTLTELLPAASTEGLGERLRRVMAQGRPERYEARQRMGGRTRWLQLTHAPLRDAEDAVTGILGLVRDTSARREAEAGARFRALVEAAPDGVLLIDEQGRIRVVNEQACAVFGYPREVLLALAVEDLVPERFRGEHRGMRQGFMSSPAIRAMGMRATLPALRSDGVEFPAEISLSPIEDGGERLTIAMVRDQTRRSRVEMELRRSQRVEALARLAGGIAHEYNNAVTSIMGYVDMLLARPDLDEGSREPLRRVLEGAQRTATLTRQLQAFSSLQEQRLQASSLAALLPRIIESQRDALGPDVDIITQLESDLPPVWLNPRGLGSVLRSLLDNARDAMDGKGRLLVEAHRLDADIARDRLLIPSGPHGSGWVCLDVEDSGRGMDPKTLERATEPFFTTKPIGEGSGLGLSTAEGIVHQWGGKLFIESEPGGGTQVRLCLPCAPADESA